jgi:oxygen-independent coproporphyrinogen-3 oxidase
VPRKEISLYVHVPFCAGKCAYCDFYSIPYERITADLYKSAVIRNVKRYVETGQIVFDTVYFGGGTPSLLPGEIAEITAFLRESGALSENAEISVEANPSDICAAENALGTLRGASVNRVSVGAQSLNEGELRFLGRRHDPKMAAAALANARKAGFENISADIMLGIPGQTADSLYRTLGALAEHRVVHVSAYILKIEEGTPLAAVRLRSPEAFPGEDETAELYLRAADFLGENGFAQYEISNFAKPGFECAHNLKYWRCGEYIGLGPAAHSFYGKKRFAVPKDVEGFIAALTQETYVTEENPADFGEWAMLKLRLTEGITFAECEERGVKRETLLERASAVPRRCLRISETGVSLTAEGFLAANSVISAMI